MRRILTSFVATAIAFAAIGCSGSSDDQYGKAAPPAGPNAVAGTPMPNKVKLGGRNLSNGGGGAGPQTLKEKPPGQ